MIRTILRLDVAPGHAAALVGLFRDRKILETSLEQPGCIETEIVLSQDETEAIVTALWDDEDAYARWTARSDRGSLSDQITAHLTAPLAAETVGRIYRVAHRPTASS